MGDLAVVGGVLPALRHGAAQAVVRRSHLPHQRLQVVRLHTVVLSPKKCKLSICRNPANVATAVLRLHRC